MNRQILTPVAGAVVAAFFALSLMTGCEPVEPVDPAADPGGIDIRAARAEEGESPEPAQEMSPEEFEMLMEGRPEPEEVDIEDPDREPDTVLAAVDGSEILLQDLYDEFARFPAPQQQQLQYQQHLLLDEMIQQQLLYAEAVEQGMEDTESYKALQEEIKAHPMAEELGEEYIRKYVLTAALLQEEVIERMEEMEISDEDLRALFNQYQHMMPEDADFEEMKPQLEQILRHQRQADKIEEYIQDLYEESEIEIDEDWMEEKEQEAAEAAQPMMPVE